MANPTSNFGWQMPTATDLVTDLPADFEVFGQAVDTDFVDLLGGTTGQILSKTSATDLDFTWINNDQGDITAVTAGTGISGGGTSGAVTITNSMATAIDAKGDLIGGTGADAFSRLAVGANATVLTADSAEATGMKWATPAGGKVLQVVMGSTSSTMTTSSSTYADTNLTGTITPTLNTSKVLILVSQNGCLKFGGTAANGMGLKLLRTTTDIAKMADAGMILAGNTANNGDFAFSIAYLDSPSTTSATTYKTQANASGNAVQMILQNGACLSTIILMEIGA